MILLRHIKGFFEPRYLSYEIKLPMHEVLEKMNAVLDEGSPQCKPGGLVGSITGNKFVVSLLSLDVEQANFSAAMRGTVTELRKGATRIDIYILRDSTTYLTFFLIMVGAILELVLYGMHPEFTGYLYWGLGLLIGGTIFSIWVSNSSVGTLQKKFESSLQTAGLKII